METQRYFICISIDNQPVSWEIFRGCLLDAKTQAFLSASEILKQPHQTIHVEISQPGIVITPRGECEIKDTVWQDITH